MCFEAPVSQDCSPYNRLVISYKYIMKKILLCCAALLFAGGAMAQNESKWRELARRDYEHCLAKLD